MMGVMRRVLLVLLLAACGDDGVRHQVHQRLVQEARVAVDLEWRLEMGLELDAVPHAMGQDRDHRIDALAWAHHFALPLVQARECAQLQHQLADALQASSHLAEPALGAAKVLVAQRVVGARLELREAGLRGAEVADGEGERIVALVRDAGDELAE